MAHLDELNPVIVEVGYGALGRGGELGYEGKRVWVGGRQFAHALSTHPPAHLVYDLDGRWRTFRARAALSDDVPHGRSHADFYVIADGREVAVEARVTAGERGRFIQVDIGGARKLELIARTDRWDYSHAVWIDPELDEAPPRATGVGLADCLRRVEILPPLSRPRSERCVATVVSPGFEHHLDDLLGSLAAHGCIDDAATVVFAVEPDERTLAVIAAHGATAIRCRRLAPINATVKAVLYTTPHVVDAKQFLCLDADMLVLGDLRPIFAAMEACPPLGILACREANNRERTTLEQAIVQVYGGRPSDFGRIMGAVDGEPHYPLVVNDGLFAGSRAALLALDGCVRSWEGAPAWVDERRDVWWRNQFIFNLALARLLCGIELSPVYNVQLDCQEAAMSSAGHNGDSRVISTFRGWPARVLHFNGRGRHKYPEHRGRYARLTGRAAAR